MNEDTPVTLVDLIDQLVPPPEPPAISMMPQTWGWIILAACLLVAVLIVFWRWRTRYLAIAYQREALAALRADGSNPQTVALVLRRCALAAFPRSDVAGLSGTEWLAFLDRTGGGTAFCKGAGRVVAQAPYAAHSPDTPGLSQLAEHWVRRHQVET
jgi:Ca-activated chloride channel family protein